jgi:hypothetical protein
MFSVTHTEQQLYLVGYTSHNNTEQGCAIPLVITADYSVDAGCFAKDSQTRRLVPLLHRISWLMINHGIASSILANCCLQLMGQSSGYQLGEVDSAGLALAIGLYNIARKLNGSRTNDRITGIGYVRHSGDVEITDKEMIKQHAVRSQNIPVDRVLTYQCVPHLLALQSVLAQYQ